MLERHIRPPWECNSAILRKLQLEASQLLQHKFVSNDQNSPTNVRSWFSLELFCFFWNYVAMSFGSWPNFLDHQPLRTTKITKTVSCPMLIFCDNIIMLAGNKQFLSLQLSRIPCSNDFQPISTNVASDLLGNWVPLEKHPLTSYPGTLGTPTFLVESKGLKIMDLRKIASDSKPGK